MEKRCRFCNATLYEEDLFCPACGKSIKKRKKSLKFVITLILSSIAVVLGVYIVISILFVEHYTAPDLADGPSAEYEKPSNEEADSDNQNNENVNPDVAVIPSRDNTSNKEENTIDDLGYDTPENMWNWEKSSQIQNGGNGVFSSQGDYVYFLPDKLGELYKYNVKSGEVTYVCDLNKSSSGGAEELTVFGNWIICYADGIRIYEINNSDNVVSLEGSSYLQYNEFVYYSHNEKVSASQSKLYIARYNLKTGQNDERFVDLGSDVDYVGMDIYNDKMAAVTKDRAFIIDLDGNNVREFIFAENQSVSAFSYGSGDVYLLNTGDNCDFIQILCVHQSLNGSAGSIRGFLLDESSGLIYYDEGTTNYSHKWYGLMNVPSIDNLFLDEDRNIIATLHYSNDDYDADKTYLFKPVWTEIGFDYQDTPQIISDDRIDGRGVLYKGNELYYLHDWDNVWKENITDKKYEQIYP